MSKAAVFCLAAGLASAQTVRLSVNTDSVLHGIDEKIYGQFLGHLYHSVSGGLWGDVVWNGSFEEGLPPDPSMAAAADARNVDLSRLIAGVPVPARHWTALGAGGYSVDTASPLNGRQSLRISAPAAGIGIEQSGYAVRAGDSLRGSLWAAGNGPGLVVRLVDGPKVLAEQTLAPPAVEWREFPLVLTPSAASGNATLRILAVGPSVVRLDQVSLMADSSRANGGLRPDLTQAMAALRPPVIRWPGGSFVNNYRWKDGIGPQAKRTGKAGGDEWDPLSFGVDEFLAFARRIGAEPVIVIWVGPREKVDRASYLQDAVDFVEYCNGSRDTRWGKLRAENGHREPHRVKYWELDNEVWPMPAAEYVKVLREFIPAMKRVDPAIRTIASGSGQLGERWPEGDLAVIRETAQLVDYLSIHHHEKPERFEDGLAVAARFWKSLEAEIAKSRNPKMKLYISEWNAQSTDWRTGLYAAGLLNLMERDPAIGMAAPAPWLRHVSAPAGEIAFINFDQRSWFPAPNYVVMKLFRERYAPDLLEIAGSPGRLNANATRSPDGEKIYLKLVNPAPQEVSVEVALRGDFPLLAAALQLVAPDSLTARNTLAEPNQVHPVDAKLERSGMTVRLTLPRWSVAVLTLSR